MNSEQFKEIRLKLKELNFKNKKWTQADLAQELTRTRQSILLYESGAIEISDNVARKMVELLTQAQGNNDLEVIDYFHEKSFNVKYPVFAKVGRIWICKNNCGDYFQVKVEESGATVFSEYSTFQEAVNDIHPANI